MKKFTPLALLLTLLNTSLFAQEHQEAIQDAAENVLDAQTNDAKTSDIVISDTSATFVPLLESNNDIEVVNVWDDQEAISTLALSISGQTLATDKEHETYNAFIAGKWDLLKTRSLIGAEDFRERELDHLPPEAQVFYPFGGPDMVYPLVFFPSAKNYILIGLEPTGSIAQTQTPLSYSLLTSMMANIFNSGFFVTDKMNRNLKSSGTLPILLGLIAKMDYTPTKVEEIRLKNLKGIRIHFKNQRGEEKNVAYYRGDLTQIDPKIFGKSHIAMIKCCSYFMHGGNVPLLKNYLMKEVDYLLQDDTGMPFRELLKSGRHNIFYGDYTGPYGNDFPWAKQPDLVAIYANKSNVRELGFRIGYGFGKAPSNLQLSILESEAP